MTQGQYGGKLTPAITSPGGAALVSNLGSAAMGMLTGGGSLAIQAALDSTKETSTSQRTDANIGPQSTGSKVFNLQSGADAMEYNDFWSNVTGTGKSAISWPLVVLLVAGFGIAFYFLTRRGK